MIQKKICMLGVFAVGKTSLVQQFVKSIFTDKYHTTVGVKIDKKLIELEGEQINLLLWDLAGEDDAQKINTTYLRGASGYILVVDGTRRSTLEKIQAIQKLAEDTIGQVPFICLINKIDLIDQWELKQEDFDDLAGRGWIVIKGSARTGEGVELAFHTLANRMLEQFKTLT